LTWDPTARPEGEDTELVITRTFDAPRVLVWRCFMDPSLLVQWWGPEGFTCTRLEMDFRAGGHWHVTITSPDGVDFPAHFTFIEIVEPERIVYRNAPSNGPAWKGNPPALYTKTLTFEETADEQTLLTLRAVFASPMEKDDSIRRGFKAGTEQSLDKLNRLLARRPG
jgi:uncharacterized protein YndB with AHSA1/START domain